MGSSNETKRPTTTESQLKRAVRPAFMWSTLYIGAKPCRKLYRDFRNRKDNFYGWQMEQMKKRAHSLISECFHSALGYQKIASLLAGFADDGAAEATLRWLLLGDLHFRFFLRFSKTNFATSLHHVEQMPCHTACLRGNKFLSGAIRFWANGEFVDSIRSTHK